MRPPLDDPVQKPFILNDKEERILDLLRDVGCATEEDIRHVLFRDKSAAYIRSILAKLSGGRDFAEAEVLYRFPVPSTAKGTKQRAYALGAKAGEVKAWEGFYRPSKARNLSFNVMAHNLRLTRFICSVHAMFDVHPQVRLADIRMCYDIARELRKLAAPNDGLPAPVLVVPDAWIHFELLDAKTGAHQSYLPIWLEVDNNTMYRLRFQQHVADRIDYIRSEQYANFYGEAAVRIAYATIGSRDEPRHSRLFAMRSWTEEVIKDLELADWNNVFYFTSLVYEDLYHLRHFTEAVWQTPADDTKRHLLGKNPAQSSLPEGSEGATS